MSRKTGRSRAQRRAEVPATAAPAGVRRGAPAPVAAPAWRMRTVAVRVVWVVVAGLLFWSTWRQLSRQITWYLAVDQFGYLTFAHDLLHGHIFHPWSLLDALGDGMQPLTDVLVQTYVRDGSRIYCRYSPGFPIVLAAWIGLFGDDAAHLLNPLLFLVLVGLSLAFQWRVFRCPFRATVGAVLMTLFPTAIHLWGLTLTRDVAAHVAGFSGLFLLLPVHGRRLSPGRGIAAGVALGFAACIRPDAVLYLVPGAAIVAYRLVREHAPWSAMARRIVAVGVGVFVGVSPALAYNWIAVGNPFLPTQGMELGLLPQQAPPAAPPESAPGAPAPEANPAAPGGKVGFPSIGWHGGTGAQVQGGGLSLSNLPKTMPGMWRNIRDQYTPFLLAVAGWGAVVALVRHRALAALAWSYVPLAFFFFSCWPRPDNRYMIGALTVLPMLVSEGLFGTLDLVRMAWKLHRPELARGIAGLGGALLLAGAAAYGDTGPSTTLPPVVLAAGGITAAALLVAAVRPQMRVVAIAAPLVAMALVGIKMSREDTEAAKRAPFQRPAMVEARTNFSKLVEPNAVVITTEDVGRPAENIEYYAGVPSVYLTDLARWGMDVFAVSVRLLAHGKRPYLYLPPGAPETYDILQMLRERTFNAELVTDIPPSQSMAYFVAAPFHRGMRMQLYRLSSPVWEEALKRRAAENVGRGD